MARREPQFMKAVKIHKTTLPGLLPAGSRCDFEDTPIARLGWGDVVVTPDGKFRRVFFRRGARLWVSDESGRELQCHCWSGSLYRAHVSASVRANLAWMAGCCWSWLQSRKAGKEAVPAEPCTVAADPRQFWQAPPISS